MKRKILMFSEMRRIKDGWASGYSAICEGLATALTKAGHEVKVLALSYTGEEHAEPFAVIPLLDPSYAEVQLRDIIEGWYPDGLVVALDLPMQMDLLKRLGGRTRYIGVFPIEGAPVLPGWADMAALFDAAYTLSEFGVQALAKAGVKVRLLPVGATRGLGRAARGDVRTMLSRASLEGRYLTLKIADNHGRKNWAHTIEFWSRWAQPDNVLYMVTRPQNAWGWDLGALMDEFGGQRRTGTDVWAWPDGKEVRMVHDLGRNELAWLYNLASDNGCLLMDTGNEGLGMPILEAFWVGVPVVGMNHTAIGELLAEGRGLLFEPGYEYRDPFGNVRRYYPAYDTWAAAMEQLYRNPAQRVELVMQARAWVEQRRWATAAEALLEGFR